MKTKRVLRYYCDHCKKAGCSKSHMAKHERRCTNNPNRECGFCNLRDGGSPDMLDLKGLIALLPDPKKYRLQTPDGDWETPPVDNHSEWERYYDDMKVAINELRIASEECPACMLAAFRQSGNSKFIGPDHFDYRKEADAWLKDWNAENSGGTYY